MLAVFATPSAELFLNGTTRVSFSTASQMNKFNINH